MRGRKFQHSFRSAKNGLSHLQRFLRRLPCAALGCHVNHIREVAIWVGEVPSIASKHRLIAGSDARLVGTFHIEHGGVAGAES